MRSAAYRVGFMCWPLSLVQAQFVHTYCKRRYPEFLSAAIGCAELQGRATILSAGPLTIIEELTMEEM